MKKQFWMNWCVIVLVYMCIFTQIESRECVYASETELVTSGTCGENATWEFDLATGTLYLGGSGSVEYGKWSKFTEEIETIVIGKDILAINLQNIWRYSSGSYSNFTNIEVNENNSVFSAKDGILFDKNESSLIWFPQGRGGSYVIPNGVTRIENYGFYSCREIIGITIPSSVSTIGTEAFDGCVELSTVNFSEGLRVIESRAFSDCIRLKEVSIPASVTCIGQRAFAKCAASKYGITGLESVKILGSNTRLEGTSSVDSGVFYGCSGLKRVETASDIGSSAFVDCVSLEEVILHDGVEKIGENAFVWCTSLTMIDIPKSVTEISGSAFGGCNQLKCFIVDAENTSFSVEDGVLFNKDKTKLIRYPNGKSGLEYEVPKSVVNLDEHAFSSCLLQEIHLQSKLNSIGQFGSCVDLKSFVIPDGIVDASEMLTYCSSLEYIVVPRSVEVVGSYKANTLMLTGCPDTMVIYGYSDTVMEKSFSSTYTFICLDDGITVKLDTNSGSNSSASRITVYPAYTYGNMPIPQRDGYIFKGWYTKPDGGKKVEADTLVELVQEHTLYAQWEKKAESSIAQAKVTLSKTSYNYDGKSKKPTVTVKLENKKLVKDKDYTVSYKNNKNIGSATVIIKGKGSYTGTITKTFTIKAKKGTAFTFGSYKYKVTSSSTVAFTGLKSSKTTKVTISKTVKYGGKTFKVTSIADKALKGKTKVTQITIGANVKTIGVSAFEGCKKLSKVTIGSAVTTIEDKAFKNCTALKSITIPSKVTKIDKQAFYGCKKLKTIAIKSAKLKNVGKDALKGIYSKATIKVPKKKLTSYKKLLKNKGQGTKVRIVSM
ncbi:MAG: leucine-rich repeat protein [Agathobacter sp.]|nr:leucine-rich repeat protein [Agathobacter sp.]